MQLALILGIIVLLFGTKKLTNVGGDVGAAIRNFRSEMKRGQGETEASDDEKDKIIEGEATKPTSESYKFKKKDNVK
jgi:sec-independent protein translocase protein TatA